PALVRRHFDATWLADPRVHWLVEDGRNYVAHTNESYDVIAIEVGQIVRPGLATFYTEEFYREVRARLAPGGLVSQFVPIAPLAPDEFRAVLRTFADVFPSCALWYNTDELLLLGRRDGDLRLDREALAR